MDLKWGLSIKGTQGDRQATMVTQADIIPTHFKNLLAFCVTQLPKKVIEAFPRIKILMMKKKNKVRSPAMLKIIICEF